MSIDESTGGWVDETALLILNEESLSDPLVDDDDSDEGLVLGLVVCLIDGLTKLSDFVLKHLATHGITNTITIDDEVLWENTSILALEAAEGSLDAVLERRTNDFLALALNDSLGPVLAHVLIDRGTETDNGVRA